MDHARKVVYTRCSVQDVVAFVGSLLACLPKYTASLLVHVRGQCRQ